MSSPHDHSDLLERYLDGLLDERERSAFEASLREDAQLRSMVEMQGRIDASLRRLFEAKRGAATDVPSDGAVKLSTPVPMAFSLPRWFGAVAALLVLGIGLAAWLMMRSPEVGSEYPEQAYRTPEMVYRIEVQRGFTPQWVCKTDQEFATTYWKALGQAVVVRDLPEDVQALGLSYTNTFSTQTVFLLARVQGRPVIVLADRLERATPVTLSPESGLHQHRRQMGELVFYEISPWPKPGVLDSFQAIKMPEGWK